MTSTMCRRRIAKCASLIGFIACPTLMLVLVRSTRFAGRIDQKTECSPQLARLTPGHICMRGDYVRRPDLPVMTGRSLSTYNWNFKASSLALRVMTVSNIESTLRAGELT